MNSDSVFELCPQKYKEFLIIHIVRFIYKVMKFR